MSWIIEKTGPGEKDNRVEFYAFRQTCAALATVDGVREWTSPAAAAAALETYRANLRREAAEATGQRWLFS